MSFNPYLNLNHWLIACPIWTSGNIYKDKALVKSWLDKKNGFIFLFVMV